MVASKNIALVSVEAYLRSEKTASVKHEYVDGLVYAMTGSTIRHRTIAQNIYSALRATLKGSGCRVDIADAQVSVAATNSFYYPDIVVYCGAIDDDSKIEAKEPRIIVEVLSSSTAAIDRREKAFAYRKIPSLKEYLIVYQRNKRAELHRRDPSSGIWMIIHFVEDEVTLDSTPCGPTTLPFSLIYEMVLWESNDEPHVRENVADYGVESRDLELENY